MHVRMRAEVPANLPARHNQMRSRMAGVHLHSCLYQKPGKRHTRRSPRHSARSFHTPQSHLKAGLALHVRVSFIFSLLRHCVLLHPDSSKFEKNLKDMNFCLC